jgi:hypothetical protein
MPFKIRKLIKVSVISAVKRELIYLPQQDVFRSINSKNKEIKPYDVQVYASRATY